MDTLVIKNVKFCKKIDVYDKVTNKILFIIISSHEKLRQQTNATHANILANLITLLLITFVILITFTILRGYKLRANYWERGFVGVKNK